MAETSKKKAKAAKAVKAESTKAPAPEKPKAKPKAESKFGKLRAALLSGKAHSVEDLMKISGFDKRNVATALYIIAKRPPKGTDPILTEKDQAGRVILKK